MNLLEALGKPAQDGPIKYIIGYDSFPAFQLGELADIRKPSSYYIQRLQANFAILVTMKPSSQKGGLLFAIVNPLDTIIQLGVEVSDAGESQSLITLFHTDHRISNTTVTIASFSVPALANEWSRFALKVQGNTVTLHLNCEEYERVQFVRSAQELEFIPGSTLYIGQGGEAFAKKYLVR